MWLPLRFPGQYYDEETDLVENWHRYYDPSIGRYLQPEPMMRAPWEFAIAVQRARQMSSYAYAGSNPLVFFDPTGLISEADENDEVLIADYCGEFPIHVEDEVQRVNDGIECCRQATKKWIRCRLKNPDNTGKCMGNWLKELEECKGDFCPPKSPKGDFPKPGPQVPAGPQ